MDAMASKITSLTIVYSTIYSGGEFPAQMASYAENVSIWWRHHAKYIFVSIYSVCVRVEVS